jgi:hypothetical protein
VVYVDALLLNIGGNLHDAVSIAAKVRHAGACICCAEDKTLGDGYLPVLAGGLMGRHPAGICLGKQVAELAPSCCAAHCCRRR